VTETKSSIILVGTILIAVNGQSTERTTPLELRRHFNNREVTVVPTYRTDVTVTTDISDCAFHGFVANKSGSDIDHRGNVKRKTDLEFLVSWLGYDDRDNSWEPYSYLRDTGKLHDYLTQKNMRQLIPAKFR
jgi:Chromo (CHRromatin Organisation MOdifier) domain